MSTPVKMPQFGESVIEGTVTRWLKAEGESVQKLEPLLEVSTDKIDSEVPAPQDGVLLQILIPEGETVDAGTVIGYIGQAGEETPDPAASSEPRAKPAPERPSEPESVNGPGNGPGAPSPQPPSTIPPRPSGRDFISPVVARMAAEHDIDIAQIEGTGLGGRVTKKDMAAYLQRREETAEEGLPATKDGPIPPSPAPALEAEEAALTPLSAMRRTIAAHMVQSKETSPHVTTIFEVDMGRVVAHREAHKADFAGKGLRLTFTPYFVAAAAQALQEIPEANGRFSEEGILLNRRIHIGVAVAVDQGLLVPIIRDADERNLQGLARAVNDVSQRARQGKVSPDEVQGGTFTITNHGVGGSLAGTPIINQPQSAILGVGAIVKRPVVRSLSASLLPSADDAIVIRPICYLSLSFDHRILDGARADAFLTRIKTALENWT